MGAAFFTQTRERNGGMVDVEFKPTDNDTIDLSAFSSKLDRQQLQPQLPDVVDALRQLRLGPGPGYPAIRWQGNTLTSATFAPVLTTDYGVYDQISRPDEVATANFVNLDNTWNATDALSFFGQVGYSWGDGKTPTQDVSETSPGHRHRCRLPAERHRHRSELQSGHAKQHDADPGRCAGGFRLDLRRSKHRREGHGNLGQDRQRLQDRQRCLEGLEVRRAL